MVCIISWFLKVRVRKQNLPKTPARRKFQNKDLNMGLPEE
jgi:hypothetical protein